MIQSAYNDALAEFEREKALAAQTGVPFDTNARWITIQAQHRHSHQLPVERIRAATPEEVAFSSGVPADHEVAHYLYAMIGKFRHND